MNRNYWLTLPYFLLNGVLLIAVLFKGMQVSLGYYPVIGLKELRLEYFHEVLTDSFFQKSLIYSSYLALSATFLSLLLGLGLAFLVLRSEKAWMERLLSVPIALPHIIVSLMIIQLISQTGMIARLCYFLGFIHEVDQFPLLVHDSGGFGVLLVFLYKEIPYVVLSTLAVLKQIEFGYVAVAKNLGANKKEIFLTILFPMIQKTLSTLFIILFCFTLTSFEVPYLLGNPKHKTVALIAYDLFTQSDLSMRPKAFALNMTVTVICFFVSFVGLFISRKLPGGKESASE